MHAEPQDQHRWLERFLGEWVSEVECLMGPDQEPLKTRGTEVVRPLGGLWVVGEGEGEMPGGGTSRSILTLGFDTLSGRFVGTFVASVMPNLWVYDGSLDPAGRVLTLDTEGPDFRGNPAAKYQDIIEFVSDDHRILTSQTQGPDGAWQRFMTAHYRRTR